MTKRRVLRRAPLAGALGLGLLAAACAGGGSPEATPTLEATPAATTAAAATVEATAVAEATSRPRADALTGAPLPPVEVASAAYDATRANHRGGTFPPLNYPADVRGDEAGWLRADDLVLGAVRDGQARAYPLYMMTLHHVANDELAGKPYLVTF